MSDYESGYDAIAKARADAEGYSVASRVTGMPPGYAAGFDLTLNSDYQVTVSAGATTVFGAECRIEEATQLTDSMFVGSKIGPYWFYIYLARDGNFHIDRAVPSYATDLHYYRHPLQEWRAMGRLWVSDAAGSIASEIIYVQKGIENIGPLVVVAPDDSNQEGEAQYTLTGTDDHLLLQVAMQYLSEVYGGGTLRILAGTPSLGAQLEPYSNTRIEGVGLGTILTPTGNTTTFNPDSKDGIEIVSLCIDASNNTSVNAIFLENCPSAIVRDVVIDSPATGVAVSGTTAYDGAVIDAVTVKSPKNTGISTTGECRVINCVVNGEQTVQSGNLSGIVVSGNTVVSNCVVTGLYSSAGGGSQLRGVLINGSGGQVISPYISDLNQSGGGASYGILVLGTFAEIIGGSIDTVDGASTKMAVLSSGTYTRITGLSIAGATDIQNGVYITAANNAVLNCKITGTTGYGILSLGTTASNIIGNTLSSNTTADIGTTSTNDIIIGNDATSGTPIDDSGTNTLQLGNSWNMTGGTLTLPPNIDISGTLDVTGATTLDSTLTVAGNAGFGTTDIEAWGTGYQAIEFADTAIMYSDVATDAWVGFVGNAYFDGAWKYKTTDEACVFNLFDGGGISFRQAVSGTIDTAISWSTPFIINVGSLDGALSTDSTGVDMAGTLDVVGDVVGLGNITIGQSSDNVSRYLIFQSAGSATGKGLTYARGATTDGSILMDATEHIVINYMQSDLASRELKIVRGSGQTAVASFDASGNISLGADTDVEVNAARTALHNTGVSDNAWFSHYDMRSTNTAFALKQSSTGITYLNANSTKDIYFQLAGTTVMKMNETGLNIGSSDDPIGLLSLVTTSATANELLTLETEMSWGAIIGDLQDIAWRDNANVVGAIGMLWDGTNTNMQFHSMYAGGYTTNVLMTIKGDGNVGIGTTSPQSLLHLLNGTLEVEHETADANIIIDAHTDGDARIIFREASTTKFVFGLDGSDSDKLKIGTTGLATNTRLTIDSTGNLGIGTATIPHGGVGAAKIAIDGTNASAAGPHIQITTDSDDYPLLQVFSWQHDTIALLFDAYYDNAYRSSDAGSNYAIRKTSDTLYFQRDAGIAAGNIITWDYPMSIKDTVKIGAAAGSDYSEFEADGTLEFNGAATVWRDINLAGAVFQQPAADLPDIDEFISEDTTDTGVPTYAFAVGEKVAGNFEMQHDYKEGSDITFHIHWQGIAAPTGTDYVKWQLTYVVAKDGDTLDPTSQITGESAIDTQYEFVRTDLTTISDATIDIGDQFLFVLERVAAAGDAYAGDALTATLGIHYECDTHGSRQIGTK